MPIDERDGVTMECVINDEYLYRAAPEGVLEVSIAPEHIPGFLNAIGVCLPAQELMLQGPLLGQMFRFVGVREIRSLPRKDGSFFIVPVPEGGGC